MKFSAPQRDRAECPSAAADSGRCKYATLIWTPQLGTFLAAY